MIGRRRSAPPAALPDDGSAARWGPAAIAAPPIGQTSQHLDGMTGWAPFGHGQAQWEQIGAYAAPPLTQYPSLINDAQKLNGVSGLDSHWYVPSRTYVLNEQGSQFYGSVPSNRNNVGGTRTGRGFSGLVGPISARLMRGRVTAAAVRQTQMVGDLGDLIGTWAPAPTMGTGE